MQIYRELPEAGAVAFWHPTRSNPGFVKKTVVERDPDRADTMFEPGFCKTVVERDPDAFSRATWARTAQAPAAQLARLRRAAGAP